MRNGSLAWGQTFPTAKLGRPKSNVLPFSSFRVCELILSDLLTPEIQNPSENCQKPLAAEASQ
jgi:hypothetical protein